MRLFASLILMLVASQLNAAILTFVDLAQLQPVPQDYGDRIVGTVDPLTGYQYGLGGGFTPNVLVDYVENSSAQSNPIINYKSGYGDLSNAAGNASYTADAELILTPDAGYSVSLNRFDVGAWLSARDGIIKVLNSDDSVLFNSGVVTVPGTVAGGHWSYSGPVIESDNALRITFRDPTDTVGIWGSFAIDNVDFYQSVTAIPEPSACLILGVVSIPFVIRRRRSGLRSTHC